MASSTAQSGQEGTARFGVGADARDGVEAAKGRAGRARQVAERAHLSAEAPEAERFAHVQRVAQRVLPEARSVAWLHDVIEDSSVTPADLEDAGFTSVEIEAVRVLTRDTSAWSEDAYLTHIRQTAGAPGRAGRLARQVKVADLCDRLEHPHVRSNGWMPPYAEALYLLETGVPIL